MAKSGWQNKANLRPATDGEWRENGGQWPVVSGQ